MKFAEYLKNVVKVVKVETDKYSLELLKAKAKKAGFSLVKESSKQTKKGS